MVTDSWIARLLAGLVGLAPVALTGASVQPPADTVVYRDLPAGQIQQQRVLRYWTADRRASARQVRARGRGAPAVPDLANVGALWPGSALATVGRVFFSMDGQDFLCSAATVRSSNRDLVVTSGHCAKNGSGSWAENWVFVPAYRDGGGPHGGFTARRMFVPDQWSTGADDGYDVAMVVLAPSAGRHVADVVGFNDIAFAQPRGRQVYTFGYPSYEKYDGRRLAYCSGRPADDPYGETKAQGLRCDLTQGSSGGPWMSGFDPLTGTGTIVSVSSFKYADEERVMYGPYFGDAVRRLYDRAEKG
ncbi:hypothetical protein [Actinocorallia libanotica]|uniref:Peptidase n=1 Tax=Actinocorallia libanotica TaxID=46162 RepID=A0ABP4BXZ9_9ACTN